MKPLAIILLAACSICTACSRTEVDSLVEDVNTKTHQPYCFFDVANYERGLSWGPCAFSTYSMRWLYQVSLDGPGPTFSARDVRLHDEFSESAEELRPVSGEVFLDRPRMSVTIALQVNSPSGVKDFAGNGTFQIEKGDPNEAMQRNAARSAARLKDE